MLTMLRNNAQSWIIKVLLGIIVVTFVISFGVGTFTNPKEVLVEVGNDEIMVSDYVRQYQQELERLRQRFPDNAETLAAQLNLRQQVLDRMVNRHLLLTAAQRERLIVSEEEIKDAVTREPAFLTDDRFDFETYRLVLAQNGLTPAEYEVRLRDDLMIAKYQRNQLAGMVVSKPEIEQRYRIENEQVEVDYVHVDPARMKPAAAPGEAALKAYYEAHPEEFTVPARFRLNYFVLSLEALEEELNVRDRAVERYYERNLEREFTTPKRLRASHILKRLANDATADQVAQARGELQAVLAKARGGEDFAALARQHSQDFSADKGGDLGFFTRDEMVPAFADAAFALPQGGISDIVRSPFGLHLIKVTAIEPGSRKELEQVRAEIAAKLRTQRAERKLELELERLPGRLRQDGVESVAKSLGQTVQATPLFDAEAVLAGLGSAAPLYAQVGSRRKGDTGVWRRNPVQGHVFYQVAERQEPTVPPLEAVKAQVAQAVRAQQQRERAVELAKEGFQQLQDGQSLETLARAHGLSVQSVSFAVVDPSIEGIGVNPEFQRAAFGLSAEKPYALNIKDEKAYLLRFKRRYLPAGEQEAKKRAEVAQELQRTLREYVLAAEVARLRSQVKVDVLAPEYLASSSSPPVPTRTAN